MTIDELVSTFQTTPFLFIGSGISRRYYNLPDWEGLLKEFASRLSNDPFIYASYLSKARETKNLEGDLPKVAELIEVDFNHRWFSDPQFRTVTDEAILNSIIKHEYTPFKAEVSKYIQDHSVLDEHYAEEVSQFRSLSQKSITGIITTNYDNFIESNVDGYKVYTGQEELIFSSLQGIAEIYKIHGCCSKPDSLVLTESDYKEFDSKEAYLAAKLMTIFVEYPIVFLGYSISDANIRNILTSIVSCLSAPNLAKLKSRLIFVSRADYVRPVISNSSMMIDRKEIPVTKVELSDFSQLYRTLSHKKTAMPVKLLRFFKQEYYNFIKTNRPSSNLIVRDIDDTDLQDSEYVIAIGRPGTFGLKGLCGMTSAEWYGLFITANKNYSADELLTYAFPQIKKSLQKIPIHKLIFEADQPPAECVEYATKQTFDNIISPSIVKNRKSLSPNLHSVDAIWSDSKSSVSKKLRNIAYLTEAEIDAEKLENILKDLLDKDPNILQEKNEIKYGKGIGSDLNRVIRLYDYLKYGKKRTRNDV